jgi:hypothetical protein
MGRFASISSAAGMIALAVAATPASAEIVELDWKTPGDKLITKDTASGLEWLDLTVTKGMSFNQVVAATQEGGALRGFRIPNLNDLFGLYGSAVGPVVPYGNGNTPIFDFTPEERAAQRAFVDKMGATFTYDYPDFGTRRDAIGFLRRTPGTEEGEIVAGGLFFYFDSGYASYSWFNNGFSTRGVSDPNTGVYLVRGLADPEPVPPAVPEPATWAMMILGFGLGGAVCRSRRVTFARA